MNHFTALSNCPVCKAPSTDSKQLCSFPYENGPLRKYLNNYYDLTQKISNETYASIFKDQNFQLLDCLNCGAIYQDCTPSDYLLTQIYDRWIPAESLRSAVAFNEYTHSISEAMRITKLLLRVTEKSVPAELKILDYGMGQGRFASAMRACGCQVYGFDLADNRHEKCSQIGVLPITFDEISTSEFDYINTEQVFEHLTSPLDVILQLAKGLSRRGVLKISVPYASWLEKSDFAIDWTAGRMKKFSPIPVQPIEHLIYYRKQAIFEMAKIAKLKNIKMTKSEKLNYSLEWFRLKNSMRNTAKILLENRIRHYYFFQKSSDSAADSGA